MHNVICLEGFKGWFDRLRHLASTDTEPGFSVTTTRGDLAAVTDLCHRLRPALLVINAEESKSLAIEELRKSLPGGELYILLVCPVDDNALLEQYLRLGCNGAVPETASDDTFRRAIHAIFEGELWVPRKLLSKLVRNALTSEPGVRLTKRETEVLNQICRGGTNQEIADHLFVSRETVRWHVRSLYSKIGVKDRQSAIRYALDIGLKDRIDSVE